MKKIISLMLACSLLLSLASCGSDTSETVTEASETVTDTTGTTDTTDATDVTDVSDISVAETTGFTIKSSSIEDDYLSVISDNSELSDLSIASYEHDSTSYTIQVDDDEERIGFLFITEDDDGNVTSIIICWSATDIVASQYKKLMASAFILGDNRLSYEDASELADEMNDIIIFGGDAVEKNGITYNCTDFSYDDRDWVMCGMSTAEAES